MFTNTVRFIFDTELVVRDIFNSLRASEVGEMGQCQRKQASRCLILGAFVCFPGFTTHCGFIFHSPVAGFSLLVFEVS
jgi:hypothetical protein